MKKATKKEKEVSKSRRVIWVIGIFILLVSIVGYWKYSDSTEPPVANSLPVSVSPGDVQKQLIGKWKRNDSDYVIEIRKVTPNNKLEALYFNPNPIHVGRAEWHGTNNKLVVIVELQDVNYPGSTYTLELDSKQNALSGKYYQAVEGLYYDVAFTKVN
jgi:hypothetical protein